MKSLGYLYVHGEKELSSHTKLSKKKLREEFGTGIEVGEIVVYRRRRYTIKGATIRERKETGRKIEKKSSPKYHRKGRTIWL